MILNNEDIGHDHDYIKLNGNKYFIHPFFDMYCSNESGRIMHIIRRNIMRGRLISVKRYGNHKQNTVSSDRFVWECHYGAISNDMVLKHKNEDLDDNNLSNLQLVSKPIKYKKLRDYSFVKNNHTNRRSILATNLDSNEVSYFRSMYSAQQSLNINAGLIKMACESQDRVRVGISKNNCKRYQFKYIADNELPEYFKKSANKRPKRIKEVKI